MRYLAMHFVQFLPSLRIFHSLTLPSLVWVLMRLSPIITTLGHYYMIPKNMVVLWVFDKQ